MNVLRKLPINIDYILGLLMMLTGLWQLYQFYDTINTFDEYLDMLTYSFLPYIEIFAGGVLMMAFPRKNLRRTIWMVSLIIAINLILLGQAEYMMYEIIEVFSILLGGDFFVYSVYMLTFSILHVGCGIAMIINGALFACKRVRSIYPIIIAVFIALAVDYLLMRTEYKFSGGGTESLEAVVATYVPHMILLGIFMLVFTSREVSWYTAKGDILRAFNRLLTTNFTFGVHTITRDQLIVLMQCQAEYTIRARAGKMACNIEVRHEEGRKILIFCRNGTDSMAAAMYVRLISMCLPDTLSRSGYVDIYGEGGIHIRMDIIEPRKRYLSKKVRNSQYARGVMPRFRHKVTNASLYHIVDGVGESDICRKKKPELPGRLVMSQDGEGRVVTIFRNDGTEFCRMPVRAVVPVSEYGAYTKLYIYGDMGRYMAFKVALPKRGQAEKPDEE